MSQLLLTTKAYLLSIAQRIEHIRERFMWVRTAEGKAYNLDFVKEIECTQEADSYSIRLTLGDVVEGNNKLGGSSTKHSVTLIKGLTKMQAYTQLDAILNKLGALAIAL
jgi:hypothetical protein